MIGFRIRYVTPSGATAQVHCYEEKADLPVFDVEVVRDGEVVEYIPYLAGHAALEAFAARRRWREVARA